MISYFGNTLLILALICSLYQTSYLIRKQIKINIFILEELKSICILFAFLTLILGFIVSDFSLKIVFLNSHSLSPLIYKISASWGTHEGSMLLWILILQLYGFIFTKLSKFSSNITKNTIAFQSIITSLFLIFILITSNPFAINPAIVHEGIGFNPILQDMALTFHPPMLYCGYVGVSLILSIAMAILLEGEESKNWQKNLQLWITLPWSFLLVGIIAGGNWAYRELGWGGFWFWDPVENISLMPWLLLTALMHSNIASIKLKSLSRLVIIISIVTFLFSIVGTFLVRSGNLSSVHSFATSNLRGIAILIIFAIIGLISFLIYRKNIHKISSTRTPNFLSKEGFIIIANIILLILFCNLLLGTLYPLILKTITGDNITVGSNFYNNVFGIIGSALLFFCAIVPTISWQSSINYKKLLRKLALPLSFSVITALYIIYYTKQEVISFISLLYFSSSFIIYNLLSCLLQSRNLKQKRMILAHCGLSILVIGVVSASTFDKETLTVMKIGDTLNFANLDINLRSIDYSYGRNYITRIGNFSISQNNNELVILKPEARFFVVEKQMTNESSVYHNFLSDIYIILGNEELDNSFVVRLYYKPLVNLIWLGGLLMFIAGTLGITNLKPLKKPV